jgi:hypothetical protein
MGSIFSMFDDFCYAIDGDGFVGRITGGGPLLGAFELEGLFTSHLAIFLFYYLPIFVLQYELRTVAPRPNVIAHRERNISACKSRWKRYPFRQARLIR